MGKVAADAVGIEVELAGGQIGLALHRTADIGVEAGITEEQAGGVTRARFGLAAPEIEAGLDAERRAVGRRRHRAGPVLAGA
jgi:hypothetical protein